MAVVHPIFILDSHEKYTPVSVESVEHANATLIGPDNRKRPGKLALDKLPADGGRMNFPQKPESYSGALQTQFGNVGYHRVVDAGGLQWNQYWLWYLYNPKVFVDVTGNHEGDWEFVQVAWAGDTPVCMTCSQHKSGAGRMYWDVEVRGGRPVVYVARDSHANYFRPVSDIPEIGDEADGEGQVLEELDWREFGTWAAWPGQWGNSTGAGQSPRSPGCQGARWSAPERYHSFAQGQR